MKILVGMASLIILVLVFFAEMLPKSVLYILYGVLALMFVGGLLLSERIHKQSGMMLPPEDYFDNDTE